MFIYQKSDGSFEWRGSFNRAEWEAHLAEHGQTPDDAGSPASDESESGEPAGNASTEEWREYAVSLGADEDEVADLTRNELRDTYGSKE